MSRADSRSLKRPHRLVKLQPNLARLPTHLNHYENATPRDTMENADRINTCMSRYNILAHDSARDVRKLRANPDQRGATSKQPLPARSAGQAEAGAAATSPIAEGNRNQDFAELVWRHFREEIGETLAEVQEDLAHRQSGPNYKVDQEKR